MTPRSQPSTSGLTGTWRADGYSCGQFTDYHCVGSISWVWRFPQRSKPVCRAAPRYPPFGAVLPLLNPVAIRSHQQVEDIFLTVRGGVLTIAVAPGGRDGGYKGSVERRVFRRRLAPTAWGASAPSAVEPIIVFDRDIAPVPRALGSDLRGSRFFGFRSVGIALAPLACAVDAAVGLRRDAEFMHNLVNLGAMFVINL